MVFRGDFFPYLSNLRFFRTSGCLKTLYKSDKLFSNYEKAKVLNCGFIAIINTINFH